MFFSILQLGSTHFCPGRNSDTDVVRKQTKSGRNRANLEEKKVPHVWHTKQIWPLNSQLLVYLPKCESASEKKREKNFPDSRNTLHLNLNR